MPQVALIDGVPGRVWLTGGSPRVAFSFTVRDGQVVEIQLLAGPGHLARRDIQLVP